MEKNELAPNSPKSNIRIAKRGWKRTQIQQSSNGPSARHLHSMVFYDNRLYIFGGLGDGEKYLDDFWQYSFVNNRWKKLKSKNPPSARHSHQAVVYQNKMILFGGQSETKTLSDIWTYCFDTKTWLQERTLDDARCSHSMTVFADKLIILGGADETKKSLASDLIVLDGLSLKDIDDMDTDCVPVRIHSSIASTGDEIYLFGGFVQSSLQDFYRLTMKDNKYIITETLALPSSIPGLHGTSLSFLPFQSQLILFGGQTNKLLNDNTYTFDLGSSNWQKMEGLCPPPRVHHQACTANGRIIVHGGLGLKGKKDKLKSLNDMWVYSDELDFLRHKNAEIDPNATPTEIWCMILSYLVDSANNIASASVVSKQFYNIIMADEQLKKKIADRAFYLSVSDSITNLVFVGPARVGKSALIIRYLEDLFITEYDPTIECTFSKNVEIEGKKYRLNVIDSAGEEDSRLVKNYFNNVHGVVMVYSIENRESFLDLGRFLALAQKDNEGKEFLLLIVGNKCDLEATRQVTREEGLAYAESVGAMWIETSALTNQNVDELFQRMMKQLISDGIIRHRKDPENNNNARKDKCLIM